MDGQMMDFPLTLTHLLRRAETFFGDGQINAYAPQADGTWERAGGLRDSSGHQLAIDGLWGIGFGNNGAAGPTTTLYFAAGPNDENDGLFGSVTSNG